MGCVGLLTLAFAALVGWFAHLRPRLDGVQTAHGISAPVVITRDGRGVPTVKASTIEDAFFALGYLHAQDRRRQAELLWRTAAGRSAELLGRAGLDSDRLTRLLGFADVTEREVEALPAEDERIYRAYALGFNAADASGRTGISYRWVRGVLASEPWCPLRSVQIEKLLHWTLSPGFRDEIAAATVVRHLGPEALDDLMPLYSDEQSVAASPPHASLASLKLLQRFPWSQLATLSPSESPAFSSVHAAASNAWAVSGAATQRGRPVLASDPHVAIAAPGFWYAARLTTPSLDLEGATVPGIPALVVGRNAKIAWGITAVGADEVDLFLEVLEPGDPPRVRGPDGPQVLSERTETIHVRGGSPETLTVRSTPRGPLLSDLLPDLAATASTAHATTPHARPAVSISWSGLYAGIPGRLLAVNRARDWDEFREALRYHHGATLNFVFASTDQIGYQLAGAIPLRRGAASRWPLPAQDVGSGWVGLVPFDALPSAHDPPSGVIVSANARPPATDVPHHLSFYWASTSDRESRIRSLLAGRNHLTPADMAAIQLDVAQPVLAPIQRWVAQVHPTSPRALEVRRRILDWDLRASANSSGAAAAEVFIHELGRQLIEGRLPLEAWPILASTRPVSRPALVRIMEAPDAHFFGPDPVRARDARERALIGALERAASWLNRPSLRTGAVHPWGSIHAVSFRNGLANGVPTWIWPVHSLLDRGPYPAPGAISSIDSKPWDPRSRFAPFAAATYRQVIDLAHPSRSLYQLPTPGQSEDPLSKHYDDGIEAWLRGDFSAFSDSNLMHTLILQPH